MKNKIITIVLILVVLAGGALGYYCYRKASITEISVGLSDIELTDEVKSELKALADVWQNEYADNGTEKVYTSQYGLLYSYKDKANVVAGDLANDSKLDKKTLTETDVLLINKNEITQEADSTLGIFVSINSKEGYYVVSPSGEEALFTEEEFKNILMKYAPTHGEIRNPQKGSEEHTAITTAAGLELDKVDIKHIACDNKYALVVANELKNPANIFEIALTKTNDVWTVVNDKLAFSKSSYIDINKDCPDMDLGLMPVYNISDFGEIDTQDMSGIADSLIQLGMMTEEDKVNMYACGCGRFAYIQPANGKKLIGYINDDKKLELNEAKDINETISYMLSCQENPPVFIALFGL